MCTSVDGWERETMRLRPRGDVVEASRRCASASRSVVASHNAANSNAIFRTLPKCRSSGMFWG